MEVSTVLSWLIEEECPITRSIQDQMSEGEVAVASYCYLLNIAIFTTKRIIFREVVGFVGGKVKVISLPYESIHSWSTNYIEKTKSKESVVELWTNTGHIEITLDKSVDVLRFDKLIANAVLK
jgi:hypothetical protein